MGRFSMAGGIHTHLDDMLAEPKGSPYWDTTWTSELEARVKTAIRVISDTVFVYVGVQAGSMTPYWNKFYFRVV